MSQATNRAIDRYRRQNVKQITVRFYPKDRELYDFVKANGGSTFLKELAERERAK